MGVLGDDGRAAMSSIPVPTALILDETISAAAKVLWMTLYQVQETGGGGPFEMTLEQMIGVAGGAKGSVIKRKKELVDAGWLAETALRGLALANIYQVITPGSDVAAASLTEH